MCDVLTATLLCPECGSSFADGNAKDALFCAACGHRVPVVRGIPRFVEAPDSEEARRTQASFGYEWTHFNNPAPSGETNFQDYFAGIDLQSLNRKMVLDAGCGMGRHARQVAKHAAEVLAVDFSAAIEEAARNTASLGNVHCIQADLTKLPLRNDSFDFVYSLGVLHHIADTRGTLERLVTKVKPGGRMRIYLYWNRTGIVGWLLSAVRAARLVTTRLPFPALKFLCWLLSLVLFVFVVTPYRIAAAAGFRGLESWPLFVYTKYPFNVLYNDQFDRFSAPIEKRYSPDDVRQLLASVGLVDINIQPCYGWIADGTRPLNS
jgi:SAM-dependent methyltransferase